MVGCLGVVGEGEWRLGSGVGSSGGEEEEKEEGGEEREEKG